MSHPPADRAAASDTLTPRELEALRHIVAGYINREVGELLFISPATVARHLANVYRKLGVDSRATLTTYALEHGLV
jgi:DNA-binding CsgD family transcriptional regulator